MVSEHNPRTELNESFEETIMNFARATGMYKAHKGSPEYKKEIAVVKEGMSQKPTYPKD